MTNGKKKAAAAADLHIVKPTPAEVAAGAAGSAPAATPEDAKDIASLWIDSGLGDDIAEAKFHTVPIGRPRDYFRTAPPEFRRRCQLYQHKVEGVVEVSYFILAPSMYGQLDEPRPCTLITVVDRDGVPRLWPIFAPREGETDNKAWATARMAARAAIDRWVKLAWKGQQYQTREAQEGYAPEPDWSKLQPFDELVQLAFGENGIIRSADHYMFRELAGAPKKLDSLDAEDL